MIPPGSATGATDVLWRWTSCTPGAVARARAALRSALERTSCDGEVVDDTVLAVSELVANAHEHASGPYELRLRRSPVELVCEVMDHDPRMPRIPDLSKVDPFAPAEEHRGGGLDALCAVLSERGRGLHIVHALTGGAWGFRCTRTNKTAWVVIPLPEMPNRSAE